MEVESHLEMNLALILSMRPKIRDSSLVAADHVKNLVLTGTTHVSATGNTLDNRITGNSGASVRPHAA
jgi:hypothetical protein